MNDLDKIKLLFSYFNQKKFLEAELLAKKLISLKKNDYQLLNIYGVILQKLKKKESSIRYLKKSININNNYFEGHYNLSKTYYKFNENKNAIKSIKKCIFLNPKSIEALILLAQIYHKITNHTEAEKYLNKARAIGKGDYRVYYNLGVLFQNIHKYNNAIINYKLAIKYNSNDFASYNNLGATYQTLGDYENAIKNYNHVIKINPRFIQAYSNYLYCLNFCKPFDAITYFQIVEKFRNNLPKIKSNFINKFNGKQNNQKINLGFVSGDFGIHPVSSFLLKIIEFINRKKFNVFAYSNSNRNDYITKKLKNAFDHWRNIIFLNDEQSASLIRRDNIQILIDLSGHTSKNRLALFANKVVPIQITWLGYNASTGLKEIDYIIVDEHVADNCSIKYFSEKPLFLPNTFQCININEDVKIARKKNKYKNNVIFGSFNNISKINKDVITVWSEILNKVNNSKLFLKNIHLEDDEIKNNLITTFALFGIKKDRLVLFGKSKDKKDVFKTYNQIDIILDTFPYPGITTSLEAIFMGVPLLTKNGSTFYSKIGASINKNLNMPDWIANNDNEYIQKAIEKSYKIKNSLESKKKLRNKFMNSPLSDSKKFTMNFERALINISKIH